MGWTQKSWFSGCGVALLLASTLMVNAGWAQNSQAQPGLRYDRRVQPASYLALPTRVSPGHRLTDNGTQEDPFGERTPPPVRLRPPAPASQFRSISTRKRLLFQDDPFGESQSPPVAKPQPANPPANDQPAPGSAIPNNDFTPAPGPPRTQDDPFGENQPQPPTGQRPAEQEPKPQPGGNEPVTPVQPGAEPVDPVLPPDAQPGLQPPTLQPGGVQDPVQPPPGSQQPQGNQAAPIDQSIEYLSSPPLPERGPARGNVYQSPDSLPVRQRPSVEYQPPVEAPVVVPYAMPTQPGYQQGGEYIVPAYEPLPGASYFPPVVNHKHGVPGQSVNPPVSYPQPDPAPQGVYQAAVAGCCNPCAQPQLASAGCDPCSESVCSEFYFGFQGGWNDLQTMTGTSSQLETETGHVFNFSVGRINGRNLRTEVELGFRGNPISDLSSPTGSLGYSGQINLFTGMTNAYWELVDFPGGRFKPYLGGGLGFASSRATLTDSLGANVLDADGDQDTSFAYQWMAGLNYKARRDLDLFVEYRFFEADAFEFGSALSAVDGAYDYQANSVGIGFRWRF